jgi:hypothetical protein
MVLSSILASYLLLNNHGFGTHYNIIHNLKHYILNSEVIPFNRETCLQTLAVCYDIPQYAFSASEWKGGGGLTRSFTIHTDLCVV